jgi:S-adenosylmethionine hydrolase
LPKPSAKNGIHHWQPLGRLKASTIYRLSKLPTLTLGTPTMTEYMHNDDVAELLHAKEVEIKDLKKNYRDVAPGKKLCRFNSNGYLEICLNQGKAASLFGLKLGSIHNDIKITFL